MIWKLLVLALIITAVLVGFRMFSGIRANKRAAQDSRAEIETEKCSVCGSFTARDAGSCGEPACPYR